MENMNKISCEIVRDLLPLYADDAVSDASRALVEAHLEACENCRKVLENCRAQVKIPPESTADPLKKVKRRQIRRIALAALAAVACAALVSGMYFNYSTRSVTVPYDAATMTVADAGDGVFRFYYPENVNGISTRTVHVERDGMQEIVLFYYLDYRPLRDAGSFPNGFFAKEFPPEDFGEVSRIFYRDFNGVDPDVLIDEMDVTPLVWEAEGAPLLTPFTPAG
ncbi:zf-HC2 domain-containing protein [Clostridiaceae bacterium]|nr:zf-HC2 domain-containing protein [Clostridiaceae bacterium]